MRKVLDITGPGFISTASLATSVKDISYSSLSPFFDSEKIIASELSQLKSTDVLFLRGPFCGTVEDVLIIKTVYKKLQKFLAEYFKRDIQQRPKILSIGKGALVLLHALVTDPMAWKWHSQHASLAPFCEANVYFPGMKQIFVYAGFQGISLSSPPSSEFNGWETFVKLHDDIVGWRSGNCYMSIVDIYSLLNPSQTDDFGYTETTTYTAKQMLELSLESA